MWFLSLLVAQLFGSDCKGAGKLYWSSIVGTKIVLLPIVSEFIFLGNLNYDKVKSEVEKQQSSGKQHMWALFKHY